LIKRSHVRKSGDAANEAKPREGNQRRLKILKTIYFYKNRKRREITRGVKGGAGHHRIKIIRRRGWKAIAKKKEKDETCLKLGSSREK